MAELQAEIKRLNEQLASCQQSAPAEPARELPDLEEIRDQVLKHWKVPKGPEKRERIEKALNNFIQAIRDQGDKLKE